MNTAATYCESSQTQKKSNHTSNSSEIDIADISAILFSAFRENRIVYNSERFRGGSILAYIQAKHTENEFQRFHYESIAAQLWEMSIKQPISESTSTGRFGNKEKDAESLSII